MEIKTYWGVSDDGLAVAAERELGNGVKMKWVFTVEELNMIMERVFEVRKKIESDKEKVNETEEER